MIVHVEVEKSIGHRLPLHEGLCKNLHGHNYKFSVAVEGIPDSAGMVVDFSLLKKSLERVLARFDHAMVLEEQDPLVDFIPTKLVTLSVAPSAENFASLIFGLMRNEGYKIAWVKVRETTNSEAYTDKLDTQVRVISERI